MDKSQPAVVQVSPFMHLDDLRRFPQVAVNCATDAALVIAVRHNQPLFQLEAAESFDAEDLGLAVPIHIDQLAEELDEVAALLRVDDGIAFGIKVGTEIVAVLSRYPEYEPIVVQHYRAIRRQRIARVGPHLVTRAKGLRRLQKTTTKCLREIGQKLSLDGERY